MPGTGGSHWGGGARILGTGKWAKGRDSWHRGRGGTGVGKNTRRVEVAPTQGTVGGKNWAQTQGRGKGT